MNSGDARFESLPVPLTFCDSSYFSSAWVLGYDVLHPNPFGIYRGGSVFDPRPVLVGFVVENQAWGQVVVPTKETTLIWRISDVVRSGRGPDFVA